MDDADGPHGDPYRRPGGSRLGAVVRQFALRRRRRSYAGAASVASPRPLLLGGLVPTPLPRVGGVTSRAVVVRDAIEVCTGGLRVRSPSGVLELAWDQIEAIEREEVAGELDQLRVIGAHGEALTFDRSVPELVALAEALAEALTAAARSR